MTMSRQLKNSRQWQGRFGVFACLGDQFRSGQSWSDQWSENQMLMPLEKLTWREKLILPSGCGWGHRWIPVLLFSSICLQCHRMSLVTEYHALGGLNNRDAFSHSSAGWKSKMKRLSELVSSENSFLRLQTAPSPYIFTSSFLHAWVEISGISSFSYDDTGPIGLGSYS